MENIIIDDKTVPRFKLELPREVAVVVRCDLKLNKEEVEKYLNRAREMIKIEIAKHSKDELPSPYKPGNIKVLKTKANS